MTTEQRAAILQVCQHLINAGIAFHARPQDGIVYPADRGLAEIEAILADIDVPGDRREL